MKTTDELLKILNGTNSLEDYLEQNKFEFTSIKLCEYLDHIIAKKHITKAEVINKSNLLNTYVYKIFSGERIPSRDKLLSICVGIKMSLNETQTALRLAGHNRLYPRVHRDSIIIFAITKKAGLLACNEILYDLNEKTLE